MKKNVHSDYSIVHETTTITLTKAFNKKASTPGTNEFRTLAELRKLFPDYTIAMRTANVPDSKECHKGLNRDLIVKYLNTLPNSQEAIAEFERFEEYNKPESKDGEKAGKVPYGKMKSWFLKKYPHYKDVDFSAASDEKTQKPENTENDD